jgi:urease accessory protein
MIARPAMTHQQRCIARAIALLLATASTPASAHTGSMSGGFVGGFAHPLFGLDHVVAMVAVGLWGAFLGAPAIWLLPIVFPLVMAMGGVIGILGVPLPGVEIGIAISAIVLGLMVALAAKPPLPIAAAIVGMFAIFHGHAHGAELPPGVDAVAYSIGFVVRPDCCTSPASSSGCWRAGRPAASRYAPQAARSHWRALSF